jgi:hypothetical protein
MRGGDGADIIDGWRREAEQLPDEHERSDLGSMTRTFAALAGTSASWRRGLRGWNVLKSPFLEEIREEARAEAWREAVLNLGRQRFNRAPTRKQKADLEAMTDPARLERIHLRLLTAPSWADLLATP